VELSVSMGSNQSTQSDATINAKLLERLQTLRVNEDRAMTEKDGYIHVDSEARMFLRE
jgi:bleomycin hydrolase